jgi:hypothetical protein
MPLQAPRRESGRRSNPKRIVASAGGSMIQAGIKNKYGLDIAVSAANMADQAVKRP